MTKRIEKLLSLEVKGSLKPITVRDIETQKESEKTRPINI